MKQNGILYTNVGKHVESIYILKIYQSKKIYEDLKKDPRYSFKEDSLNLCIELLKILDTTDRTNTNCLYSLL